MEEYPTVIILSVNDKKSADIVKGIIDVADLPAAYCDHEGISSWLWKIENKYYAADIQISCIHTPDKHLNWIQSCGEALIIYCDSVQDDAVEKLDTLAKSVCGFEPEVQLLVCDSCSSDASCGGLSRLKAQQWCIRNGWELIELKKVEDEDDDSVDDDFPESWGFQRIQQALHAHTWSNLVMKDKASNFSTVLHSVVSMDGRNAARSQSPDAVAYSRLENLSLVDGENIEGKDSQEREGMVNGSQLDSCLFGNDFEELFSRFQSIKETSSSLSPEMRRDYAEKVAIEFWKALGGPDDELEGLDSD